MFVKGDKVRSIRTGLHWVVLGYDEDTLDGARVVLVSSPVDNEFGVFPVLEHTLEAVQ